jgi:hypothetical protein
MIYLGVQVEQHKISVVALSSQFAPLGKARFRSRDLAGIVDWVGKLSVNAHERKNWYFDSVQFHSHFIRLHHFGPCYNDGFYLVDHRKLNEIVKAFYDYSLFEFNRVRQNGIAYFLASARRFMPPQFIRTFNTDAYLPF